MDDDYVNPVNRNGKYSYLFAFTDKFKMSDIRAIHTNLHITNMFFSITESPQGQNRKKIKYTFGGCERVNYITTVNETYDKLLFDFGSLDEYNAFRIIIVIMNDIKAIFLQKYLYHYIREFFSRIDCILLIAEQYKIKEVFQFIEEILKMRQFICYEKPTMREFIEIMGGVDYIKRIDTYGRRHSHHTYDKVEDKNLIDYVLGRSRGWCFVNTFIEKNLEIMYSYALFYAPPGNDMSHFTKAYNKLNKNYLNFNLDESRQIIIVVNNEFYESMVTKFKTKNKILLNQFIYNLGILTNNS